MNIRTILGLMAALMLAALTLSGCKHHDEPEPQRPATRTVLVYMAANNNLGHNGLDDLDIKEMETAAKAGAIPEGSHLVVYRAAYMKKPELIEVTPAGTVTIKVYEGSLTAGTSLTVDRMREVLADTEKLAGADAYGLVFWSHGTGWVETGTSRSGNAVSRGRSVELPSMIQPLSFGDDNGYEMKITSIASALSGRRFDFIYFDCCLMGGVEVCYELRGFAPVIVSSPLELQVTGMPYDKNVPVFFEEKPDLVKAATNTYNHYRNVSNGVAMVVVDTEALDGLAKATRDIMATGVLPSDDYNPVKFWNSRRYAFVDMTHYITSLPGVSSSLLGAWRSAYDKAVIYKAATPTCYGYDMTDFGGLASAYLAVPSDADKWGYRNQAWWKDVMSRNPSLDN